MGGGRAWESCIGGCCYIGSEGVKPAAAAASTAYTPACRRTACAPTPYRPPTDPAKPYRPPQTLPNPAAARPRPVKADDAGGPNASVLLDRLAAAEARIMQLEQQQAFAREMIAAGSGGGGGDASGMPAMAAMAAKIAALEAEVGSGQGPRMHACTTGGWAERALCPSHPWYI